MTSENRKKVASSALVLGGAVLAWWLLHGGDGWGIGTGDGEHDAAPVEAEVKLRVAEQGITVDDGEIVSQEDAVARANAAGSAIVVATGAARTGTVADLVRALLAAGVTVHATQDVWNSLGVDHG